MIALEFDEFQDFLKALKAEKCRNLFYKPMTNLTEEAGPPPAEGQPPSKAIVCEPLIILAAKTGDDSGILECVVKFDKVEIKAQDDIAEMEEMLDEEVEGLQGLLAKYYPELGGFIPGKIKVYAD